MSSPTSPIDESSSLLREGRLVSSASSPSTQSVGLRCLQATLLGTAFSLNIITVALGAAWVRSKGDYFSNQLHPFLMIWAFFFMTIAMMTYRILPPSLPERLLQYMHFLVMLLAAVLGGTAVHYSKISSSRNHKKKHHSGSLHAILGWTLISVFLFQFLVGGWSLSLVRRNRQHKIVKLHRTTGPWVYVGIAAVLLERLVRHNKCHDTNAEVVCRLQQWLAISVGLTTLFTVLGVRVGGSEPPHATTMTGEAEPTSVIV